MADFDVTRVTEAQETVKKLLCIPSLVSDIGTVINSIATNPDVTKIVTDKISETITNTVNNIIAQEIGGAVDSITSVIDRVSNITENVSQIFEQIKSLPSVVERLVQGIMSGVYCDTVLEELLSCAICGQNALNFSDNTLIRNIINGQSNLGQIIDKVSGDAINSYLTRIESEITKINTYTDLINAIQ